MLPEFGTLALCEAQTECMAVAFLTTAPAHWPLSIHPRHPHTLCSGSLHVLPPSPQPRSGRAFSLFQNPIVCLGN